MSSGMSRRIVAPAAGIGAAVSGATAVLAGHFARQVVRPPSLVDDVPILRIGDDEIVLGPTPDARYPGRYGMWQNGFGAHARIGQILHDAPDRVTRRLDGIDFGEFAPGFGRFNSYYFCGPPATSLPVTLREVRIDTVLGPMPAWLDRVPGSDRWAVLVHGRGAVRAEALRAVPVLHDAGINSLVVSYRNDPGAPASTDATYHLGLTEWVDVEPALVYAAAQGAREIQLFGWSMGAAVVLQLLQRSWLADLVSRLVLDSPVVDWSAVFDFHARLNRLPHLVGRLGGRLLRSPAHRLVTGVGERVDLREADWVRRAGELSHPMLLIHSRMDDFVPYAPSERLARARPDLIRLATWETARHCREWNVDAGRWEQLVGDFCRPEVAPSGQLPAADEGAVLLQQ